MVNALFLCLFGLVGFVTFVLTIVFFIMKSKRKTKAPFITLIVFLICIIGSSLSVSTVHNVPAATTPANTTTSTDTTANNSGSTDTTSNTPSQDDELAQMLKNAPKPIIVNDGIGGKTVTYTLTNNTKDTFDYIQIDYDVFNKQGVKIDSGMTNITNVTPGQKFNLKLDIYEDGAATWKVTDISSEAH